MRCLIGVGTIICGASAIVAMAPVVRAKMEEIAYAISTIFFFNMLAVVIFPAIGHFFHFSDTGFGLWTGTAVNDTSAVVAAGYAYSQAAGNYATIVKLTRTTLIIPITFALSLIMSGLDRRAEARDAAAPKPPLVKAIPWFIALFAAASLLNTLGAFGSFAPLVEAEIPEPSKRPVHNKHGDTPACPKRHPHGGRDAGQGVVTAEKTEGSASRAKAAFFW